MLQSVSVPTGSSATLLNSALPANAVVYNSDSKNQVWVSANPACAPGNGIPLPALGSIQWTGGAIYACCDTGVSTPVSLLLSTDATNYSNPVSIASAVASELLQQGIPSVLTGQMIPNVQSGINFDTSGYASISGQFSIPASGGIGSINFYDTTGTILVHQELISFPVSGGGISGYQFTVPVYGPLCDFFLRTPAGPANLTNISVYGSNRVLPKWLYTSGNYRVSGTMTLASGLSNLGNIHFTQGGLADFYIQKSGTTNLQWGYMYMDGTNPTPVAQFQPLIDSSMLSTDPFGNKVAHTQRFIPAGVIQWATYATSPVSESYTFQAVLP